MSIQLRLGGHCFSAEALDAVAGEGGDILFSAETLKTTLVPRAVFDRSLAEEYLAVAGVPCDESECAVCSDSQGDAVAVMAVCRNALDAIRARLGHRAKFTSPLLDPRHDGERAISLRLVDSICYVRCSDGTGVQLADVVRANGCEDVLYCAAECADRLRLPSDVIIYIGGDDAAVASASKLLKRYFKMVVCE